MANCTDPIYSCTDHMPIYYAYVYLLTSIVATGIILNTLSLAVFFKEAAQFRHLGPFVLFLRHLAFSDLLFLLFFLLIGVCRCNALETDIGKDVCNVYLAYIFRPFCNWFIAVSIWITISMSIERYIVIRKAKSMKHELTNKLVRTLVVCFYIASLILHFPFFFYMEIVDGKVQKTELAMTYGYGVWAWTRAVLAKYLPIVIITVTNICIIVELCKIRKRRIKLMKQQNKTVNTAKIMRSVPLLLGICFTFVVCNSFEPISYLDIFGPCSIYSIGYQTLAITVNCLETFSATVNFIFYVGFNSRFRHAFFSLLPCYKKRKIGPSETENLDMTINSLQKGRSNNTS